mgnify:CR=1 FL=1
MTTPEEAAFAIRGRLAVVLKSHWEAVFSTVERECRRYAAWMGTVSTPDTYTKVRLGGQQIRPKFTTTQT